MALSKLVINIKVSSGWQGAFCFSISYFSLRLPSVQLSLPRYCLAPLISDVPHPHAISFRSISALCGACHPLLSSTFPNFKDTLITNPLEPSWSSAESLFLYWSVVNGRKMNPPLPPTASPTLSANPYRPRQPDFYPYHQTNLAKLLYP